MANSNGELPQNVDHGVKKKLHLLSPLNLFKNGAKRSKTLPETPPTDQLLNHVKDEKEPTLDANAVRVALEEEKRHLNVVKMAEAERNGNQPYLFYNEHDFQREAKSANESAIDVIRDHYDDAFLPIIYNPRLNEGGQQDIDTLLREKKERSETTYALDLMSPGLFLRALKADKLTNNLCDGGISVTLGDWRSEEERAFDVEHNLSVVEGDITQADVWKDIDDRMSEQNIPGFDEITCVGKGGFNPDTFPMGFDFSFSVWENAYERLNPNGVILTQVSVCIDPEQIREWHGFLQENYPTFKVDYESYADYVDKDLLRLPSTTNMSQGVLRIVKTDGAPPHLPKHPIPASNQ